jgi:hypothetical protein
MVNAQNETNQSAVQVVPAAVDFGTTGVGKKVSHIASVTNTSSTAVTLTEASVSSEQFSVSGLQFPISIQSGQKASFTVWFNGSKAGKASGTLNFHGSKGPTPPVVLTGTAGNSEPALSVSAASHDFGNVTIKTEATAALALTNSGASTLKLSAVSVTGAATFALGRVKLPAKIAPGQKIILDITFAPKTAGTYSGSVAIASNDPENPTTNVALTGVGTTEAVGNLVATPAALSFQNVKVGSTASAATTLKNSGNANLTLSRIDVSTAGFSTLGVATPVVIGPGEQMALTVRFSPTAAGTKTAIVSLVNSQGGITTVNVSGTAAASTQPGLTLSPGSIAFGNVVTGVTNAQAVQIANPGTTSLTVTAANISGTGFVVSNLAFPLTLTAGQTSTFNVQFNPKSAGAVTGSLSLVSSVPSSASVVLSGTGVTQGGLTISPGAINFGNVVAGVTNSQTVQIGNPGGTAVTVSAANVTGTGFGTSNLTLPTTLNAGQSKTFNVQFNPKGAGASTGTLSLVSNAPSSPSISLSGMGVAAGLTLSVNPSSVSFGNVTVGTTASRNITVTNSGNSNVAIASATLTGTSMVLSGGSAVNLTPSQSITLTVQYSPTNATAANGSISVVSNATGSPATIPISGTGVAQVQHTVNLSWNASPSAAGYNVYRSVTSGAGYSRINSGLNGTLSYSDGTVQSSQSYFYVTTAVDGTGAESAFSSEVSVNIP